MYELAECKRLNPAGYIKIQAFDASIGTESCVLSFIAYRPAKEPGFYLGRQESDSRAQRYSYHSYAVEAKPSGIRY